MYLYAFSKYTYDPVPDTVLWILSKHHILPVDGLFLHAEQYFSGDSNFMNNCIYYISVIKLKSQVFCYFPSNLISLCSIFASNCNYQMWHCLIPSSIYLILSCKRSHFVIFHMYNIPRTCHRQLLANVWEQKSEVTHYPVSLFAFYIPKYARKVAIGKFSMSIYLIIFYNTITVPL